MKIYRGLIKDMRWGFEHGYDCWVHYNVSSDEITNCGYMTVTSPCIERQLTEDEWCFNVYAHNVCLSSLKAIIKDKLQNLAYIEYRNGGY